MNRPLIFLIIFSGHKMATSGYLEVNFRITFVLVMMVLFNWIYIALFKPEVVLSRPDVTIKNH